MSRTSLRIRLLAAAALSVVVALAAAGAGMTYLFERHVERRISVELSAYLSQLIGGLKVRPDGGIEVAAPVDPRFTRPLSGLYWQVEAPGPAPLLRSRSLWDTALTFPPAASGEIQLVELDGPGQQLLLAAERSVSLTGPAGAVPIRAVVAIDHRDVTAASAGFAYDLVPSLAILAAVLVAAAWLQVGVGLAPLERIRSAVADVVSGRLQRLTNSGPEEVRPLVDEINRLLAAQESALARAKTRAADLAHGLKTPLQVLAADIRALRDKGETRLANEIEEVASTIGHRVNRELAGARVDIAATSGAPMTAIAAVARRVVAVLERTPGGGGLSFAMAVPESCAYPIQEADLAEILGNLGENACRFARTRIAIDCEPDGAGMRIVVADDGPGIPEDERRNAVARGNR
ncbi:MAG: HAMP domain-containing sensor histidine kinase, partial [Bauldia sp.]